MKGDSESSTYWVVRVRSLNQNRCKWPNIERWSGQASEWGLMEVIKRPTRFDLGTSNFLDLFVLLIFPLDDEKTFGTNKFREFFMFTIFFPMDRKFSNGMAWTRSLWPIVYKPANLSTVINFPSLSFGMSWAYFHHNLSWIRSERKGLHSICRTLDNVNIPNHGEKNFVIFPL
jgi:hypothetical protein